MYFLIEPYNAYQKPPKKKHWTELAEEEALYYHIMEQQRLQNERLITEKTAIQYNQQNNWALPAQTTPPDAQFVQDASPGLASTNAGGGGINHFDYYNEVNEKASFVLSATSGVGPLIITFTNTTATPENDKFVWDFGDSSSYSTAITPPAHTYQTGSYTVILRETSSLNKKSTSSKSITVSNPAPNPRFSVTLDNADGPLSASFTNTSFPSLGSGDTLTYKWLFGDDTTSTAPTPPVHIYQTGSYIVQLQSTESIYHIASMFTLDGGITASHPTLTPLFTVDSSSGTAPLTVHFTNSSTADLSVNDSYNFTWVFGDGSSTTSIFQPNHAYASGTWAPRLEMTESVYKVTAVYTLSGGITASA